MKKEFIRDGKKIRNCDSNVAKMNLLEVIFYSCPCSIDWKEIFKAFGVVITAPFVIITFPIWIFVSAYFKRKRARAEIHRYEEYSENTKGN